MNKKYLYISFLIFLFIQCVPKETLKNNDVDSTNVYVFDDMNIVEPTEIVEDSANVPTEIAAAEPVIEKKKTEKYIVQIGAFSTKERAEKFANQSRKIISEELIVNYSSDVGLFVVQLPPYALRSEAEKIRNKLWKIKKFKDAFILTKLY